MNLQAAYEALKADPELHGEMRETMREVARSRTILTADEKQLLHVLDAMERIDPQTPEGRQRKTEADASAVRSADLRATREQSQAVKATGWRMRARVTALREGLARRRHAEDDAADGSWGDRWTALEHQKDAAAAAVWEQARSEPDHRPGTWGERWGMVG